ncbi:translation termination inhibitor protein itt1 [Ascosphaera pollenicola]|nr:translation termination inhibitor protein itt1 [Ascosphaera pollenicola]
MSIETSDTDLLDDDRALEVSSIEAIYPEIVREKSDSASFRLYLEIPVSPSEPQRVVFRRISQDGNDDGGIIPGNDAVISHFPSLRLCIELPEGYPSSEPPLFDILDIQPAWLPARRKAELIADGRRLWEECGRDMILFTYIDHLHQESDRLFSLTSKSDPLVFPLDIQAPLLDYNIKEKRRKFEQETFNSCITEGDIASVRCLSAGCAKELSKTPKDGLSKKQRDAGLSPSELLQIPLKQELVERYVSLKRKNRLEADKRTVYCPREWCQGAARSKHHPKVNNLMSDSTYLFEKDDDEDTEYIPFDPKGSDDQLPPMSERVAVCEDCSYAFCIVCRRGWHGEAALCSPQREAELSAAEKANQEYIDKYTSPCPTCSSRAQKSMGCNHMICFKCGTHFCYLCSSWLDQQNPYKHFNDVRISCHMRLWELEAGDIPVEDRAEGVGVNLG